MVIELPPDLDQLVAESVRHGPYRTPVEVIGAALQLLGERERQQRLEDLKQQIRIGIEQADRGELLDGERVFDELEQRLEQQAAGD